MSEVYRNATGRTMTLGVQGATAVSARFLRGTAAPVSAAVSSVSGGDWSVTVPYAVTHLDGDFSIEWTFTVESVVYTKSFTHSVVSPLLPLARLSTADAIELEQAVRYFIQAYTNNHFGSSSESVSVMGTGHRALGLPRRLETLRNVIRPEESFPSGYTFSPEELSQRVSAYVVSGDGWFLNRAPSVSLTLKQSPPEEFLPVYSDSIIIPPGSSYNSTFTDNSYYIIDGVWGFSSVPDDVMLAADLLFNDYNCADAAYRNRFINSIRAGNWRFDLRDDAFAGTGNLTADRLLDKYRNDSMVIV